MEVGASATTQAKEAMNMSFSTAGTGGTIVSSALKLMDEVVKERYNPAQWNIYAAQASDGDNWADDFRFAMKSSGEKLLPGRSLLQLYRNYPSCNIRHCGENMSICTYFRQL